MKGYKEMLENTQSDLKKANHTIALKDIELRERPPTKESENIEHTKVEE